LYFAFSRDAVQAPWPFGNQKALVVREFCKRPRRIEALGNCLNLNIGVSDMSKQR
jgi:hypothetical protein